MSEEEVTTTNNKIVTSLKACQTTNTKVKQKILQEEEYLAVLEKIVERDFYPELTKLRLRTSYLDALESNDLEKLRQIQIALEETGSIIQEGSPSKFDDVDEPLPSSCTEKSEKSVNPQLTLDKFLIQNTSEDNASFDKIMEATREKHRNLHAWLYNGNSLITDGCIDSDVLKMSQNGEQLKLKQVKEKSHSVETWPYVVRNSLMYNPDGLELSSEELAKKKLGAKEICHKNTRFQSDPFNTTAFQTSMQKAVQERDRLNKIMKQVGVDGHLENSIKQLPKVPEYDYVDTPSPQPGVDASPLMTWGAIEGTPLRIETTPSHLSQGPKFKIHELQPREQIAISLADKVGKRYREERKKALAAATSSIFSPKNTPRTGARTAERVSKLTPAAQNLIKKASSSIHTDKSLRESYTPTPNTNKKDTILTPSMKTPGSSSIRTPGSARGSSITDNLLNIPNS